MSASCTVMWFDSGTKRSSSFLKGANAQDGCIKSDQFTDKEGRLDLERGDTLETKIKWLFSYLRTLRPMNDKTAVIRSE